jgi:hypothetical protein
MAKTIAQYSGFFDSLGATPNDAGDIREYPAGEFAIHLRELFVDGVKRDQLKVTPSSTPYTVGVEPGFACIQGRYYNMVLEGVSDGNDPKYLPVEFEPAVTLTRIDRVVLRLDLHATLLGRWIRPMVLKGEEGSSEPPELTRNETVWEISLARLKVRAGANTIAAEDITDERPDGAVCGWCKPYGAVTPGMTAASNVETQGAYANAQLYLEGLDAGKAAKSRVATIALPISDWMDNVQIVKLNSVTADTNLLISPAPVSYDAYCESSVRAIAQGEGIITFSCVRIPSKSLYANLMIVG